MNKNMSVTSNTIFVELPVSMGNDASYDMLFALNSIAAVRPLNAPSNKGMCQIVLNNDLCYNVVRDYPYVRELLKTWIFGSSVVASAEVYEPIKRQ